MNIMVSSCSAAGCTTRQKKGAGLSFHKFPKDTVLRRKWLVAIGRESLNPTENARVCSKHFTKNDYVTQFGQKLLGPHAVPKNNHSNSESLSPDENSVQLDLNKVNTSSLDKSVRSMDNGAKTDLVMEVDRCNSSNKNDRQSDVSSPESANGKSTTNRRRMPRPYFGDFQEEDMENSLEAKRMFNIARKIIKKQRAMIKCLRVKNYRLVKRNKLLKDIIQNTSNPKPKTGNCYILLQKPGEYVLTCS